MNSSMILRSPNQATASPHSEEVATLPGIRGSIDTGMGGRNGRNTQYRQEHLYL